MKKDWTKFIIPAIVALAVLSTLYAMLQNRHGNYNLAGVGVLAFAGFFAIGSVTYFALEWLKDRHKR